MLNQYKTRLILKNQLTKNVLFLRFQLVEPKEIVFIPGQYLMLKIEDKPRLYSIASSSFEKNIVEFIVEILPGGLASTYFTNLKDGQEVVFYGPAGHFQMKTANKKNIFLTTGTGLAPVLSILKSTKDNSNNYLYWGVRYFQDIYLFEQLKKYQTKICLSREKDLLMIKNEERKYFDLGHIDEVMEKDFFNNQSFDDLRFYLCGGREVVESLKQKLILKGILPENIIFEKF
jgi:NAD(P)H-flavin reductase